nr:hypothetical protein [Tanacetum cinerariifolium]
EKAPAACWPPQLIATSNFPYGKAAFLSPGAARPFSLPTGRLFGLWPRARRHYRNQPEVARRARGHHGVPARNRARQAPPLLPRGHADWSENLAIKNVLKASHDTTWHPVCGERSQVRDHYNAAEIQLAKDDNPDYRVRLQVRAYDEGVAFRYFFPEHPKGIYYRVMAENDEFTLPEGTKA